MKISQISTPVINPNEGMSAGADRMARAKAIALGQAPNNPVTPDSSNSSESPNGSDKQVKRIKLRTQVSPDRHMKPEASTEAVANNIEKVNPAQSDIPATTEQATVASEETKPLSPQFAALAKQKRALQLQEQELLAKQKAFEAQSGDKKSLEEYRARIKANALSVLQEEGVTYDQLTEQILASNQENADLVALRAEIKAMKDGLENQTKSILSERDKALRQATLEQIKRDAQPLISQGPKYQGIREAGYLPKVIELIDRTEATTGEVLDLDVALDLVEKETRSEASRWAKVLNEIQSSENPAPVQQPRPVQQDRPGTKVMRTLTNRDGVSSVAMSKRERAIAAMEGRLK